VVARGEEGNTMTESKAQNTAIEEIVDLEDYAAHGNRPPRCRGYRIRVNHDRFVVHAAEVTGREVLELAGLTPAERYCLVVRVRGVKPREVRLDDVVDLTHPGTERFEAGERCEVTIKVNEQEVAIVGPRATGLEIKEAAIKAGVNIEADFVLSQEFSNGRTRNIGDHDVVVLVDGLCFGAVAPDDNS